MIYYKRNIVLGLKTPPQKSGNMPILLRVSFSGKQLNIYSGVSVTSSQWDKRKRRIKQGCVVKGSQYNIINKLLEEQLYYINEYFDDCGNREIVPSFDELKTRFYRKFKFGYQDQGNEFYYLFDEFIQEVCLEKESLRQKYDRLKKRLYQAHPQLAFQDLSIKMMYQIITEWSQGLDGNGTYNEFIKNTLFCFKRFVIWAQKRKNVFVNEEFFQFDPKLKEGSRDIRYLRIDEVNKLRHLELPMGGSLDKVRDCFLFACATSLRYSDLKKLRKCDIVFDEERKQYNVKILTKKNHKALLFPLTEMAMEIYEKYKGVEYPDDLLLPVISNQKYNKFLKELGERADLKGEWVDYEYRLNERIEVRTPKKDLESHTARRTFITTALSQGVDPYLIARVSSHSDLKDMKPYLEMTGDAAQRVIDAINIALCKGDENEGDDYDEK